jgi:hypothetical protein
MNPVYCLFTITSNSYYSTISGCVPHEDEELLMRIRTDIIKIRPSHGKMWALAVLETDAAGTPIAASRSKISDVRMHLS